MVHYTNKFGTTFLPYDKNGEVVFRHYVFQRDLDCFMFVKGAGLPFDGKVFVRDIGPAPGQAPIEKGKLVQGKMFFLEPVSGEADGIIVNASGLVLDGETLTNKWSVSSTALGAQVNSARVTWTLYRKANSFPKGGQR